MADNHTTGKLTEREKDCLRRWLEHKTAKEIALELDVSHHAVEKRLKMARTKLGVGSSIEAARMLARDEGYDQTVSGPPDLPSASETGNRWRPQFVSIGVLVMISIALSALALSPSVEPSEPLDTTDRTIELEVARRFDQVFDRLDADDNGYLENPESPFVTIAFLDDQFAEGAGGQAVLGDSANSEQVARFYENADTDGDGRISPPEFTIWQEARLAELGIETKSIIRIIPSPQS